MVEYRKIVMNDEARRAIFEGVNKLANLVKTTLGPNGRTVLLEQMQGDPKATKDGVSVARSIKLGNHLENMGAQVVKEVANNANRLAGDGTTTATVIAQAILQQVQGYVTNEHNVSEVREGLELASAKIIEAIDEMKLSLKDREREEYMPYLRQIALVSSNNDHEVAQKVMEAIESVGASGALKIDLGRNSNTTVSLSKGLTYQHGMASPYFAKDKKAMQWSAEDVRVLVMDHDILSLKDIANVLESVHRDEEGKTIPLVIFCNEMQEKALYFLLENIGANLLDACVVRTPGFGSQQAEVAEDIAIVTGGKAILKEKVLNASEIREMDPDTILGKARKVIVRQNECIIIDGDGGREAIDGRMEFLKERAELEEDGFMKDRLEERIAKLTTGIAIIHVGAESEVDAYEKKDRYEDAVRAVKAAWEDGVIAGGGTTVVKAAFKTEVPMNISEEMSLGFNILLEAVKAPFLQILDNAWLDKEKIYKEVIATAYNPSMGYNVRTKEFCDMYEAGIIDPALVAKVALANAVSVSGTLMTTSGAVYNYVGDPE